MDDLCLGSIVRAFVDYVNKGDPEGLTSLLSKDVVFTDILGRVYQEEGFMAGYLAEFPNYEIHVHEVLQGGDGVAIIGKTTGSHVPPEIEERARLVWTAEIREGLITEWRIYAGDEYAKRS